VDHAPSVVVHYADLDIHHDAGAQELLSRIDAAARTSCGPQPALGNLKMSGLWHECVNDAESSAVASVGDPNVSKLAGIALPATRTAAN
jgi:UrcA family protein